MNNKVKLWALTLGIGMLMCVVDAGRSVASDEIEINCYQTPDLYCSPSNVLGGASKSQDENSQLSLTGIQANTHIRNMHDDIIVDTAAELSALTDLRASVVPNSSLNETKVELRRSPDLDRSSTTLPGPLLASILALIGIVAVARRNVSGRGGMEEGVSSNSQNGRDEDHEVHLKTDSNHDSNQQSNHLPVNSQTNSGGVHS